MGGRYLSPTLQLSKAHLLKQFAMCPGFQPMSRLPVEAHASPAELLGSP